MKPITLRDIPASVAAKIQQEAERNGTSLNKTVIELLSRALNPTNGHRRLYHDLDHLAGSWSEEDADLMATALEQHRAIEPELWK